MNILTDLLKLSPLTIFKTFFLLIEFFYICFALVIFRQQKLMVQTIEGPEAPFFRLLTLVHFFASLVVFGLSFILLMF